MTPLRRSSLSGLSNILPIQCLLSVWLVFFVVASTSASLQLQTVQRTPSPPPTPQQVFQYSPPTRPVTSNSDTNSLNISITPSNVPRNTTPPPAPPLVPPTAPPIPVSTTFYISATVTGNKSFLGEISALVCFDFADPHVMTCAGGYGAYTGELVRDFQFVQSPAAVNCTFLIRLDTYLQIDQSCKSMSAKVTHSVRSFDGGLQDYTGVTIALPAPDVTVTDLAQLEFKFNTDTNTLSCVVDNNVKRSL